MALILRSGGVLLLAASLGPAAAARPGLLRARAHLTRIHAADADDDEAPIPIAASYRPWQDPEREHLIVQVRLTVLPLQPWSTTEVMRIDPRAGRFLSEGRLRVSGRIDGHTLSATLRLEAVTHDDRDVPPRPTPRRPDGTQAAI